jgi:hypothetical protein
MREEDRKLRELVANKGKVMSKCLVLISERVKVEELGLDFSYPDVWDLLPVAILCVISILFTVLWLLAVWEYVRLRDIRRHATNGLAETSVPNTKCGIQF